MNLPYDRYFSAAFAGLDELSKLIGSQAKQPQPEPIEPWHSPEEEFYESNVRYSDPDYEKNFWGTVKRPEATSDYESNFWEAANRRSAN
jgi:hypothetical protein